MAQQTFLQADLCQIFAREFGKIRVTCGLWVFGFFSSRLFFCMRSVRGLRSYWPVPRCAKRWVGINLNPSRWWMPAWKVWGELGCGWWCRWRGAPPHQRWWWLRGCLWAGCEPRDGGLHGKQGQANGSQVQSQWPRGNAREQIVLVLLPVVEWRYQFRCRNASPAWIPGQPLISLEHVDRFFFFVFFRAGVSAFKWFIAGDGYANSHVSTACTSHKQWVGMNSSTAFDAASIVPVWQLIFSIPQ